MADVHVSQFDVEAVSGGLAAFTYPSQYGLEVVFNVPADNMDVTQADLTYITNDRAAPLQVSEWSLEVVYRGRVDDPQVRTWTFTLDGHDFYVMRLGNDSTLLYDLHADQFYIWGSGDTTSWKAYDGINWVGGWGLGHPYGTNIVVGDDGNGSLYFLDPLGDQDDDSVEGDDLPRNFMRRASGQVMFKGYSKIRCYGVELLGSIGQLNSDAIPATVSLAYSDDRGQSYVSAGAVTLPLGETDARAFWRSLGSMGAPGRIFRITDYGALKRIDSLTMVAEGDGKV